MDIGNLVLVQPLDQLQAVGAGLDDDALEGLFVLLKELQALDGVDAEVDNIDLVFNIVKRCQLLAYGIDRITGVQHSILNLAGVLLGVQRIAEDGKPLLGLAEIL